MLSYQKSKNNQKPKVIYYIYTKIEDRCAAMEGEASKEQTDDFDGRHFPAYAKWFTSFCTWASWDIEEAMVWVDNNGNIVADGILRQFFKYMSKTPGMTKTRFMNAIYWATQELDKQLLAKGAQLCGYGLIRNLRGVQRGIDALQRQPVDDRVSNVRPRLRPQPFDLNFVMQLDEAH